MAINNPKKLSPFENVEKMAINNPKKLSLFGKMAINNFKIVSL